MSTTFYNVGSSIFNSNKANRFQNYSKLKTRTLIQSKSEMSLKTNINFFKQNSNFSNYKYLDKKKLKIKPITQHTQHISNQSSDININNNNNINFTAKTRYENTKEKRNKLKCLDLKTNTHFHPSQTRGYIQEANNILLLRYENKSNDILSKKNTKHKIMEDTREISRNNQIINEIKNKIEKIKSNFTSYKTALIKSQNEMNTDLKKFLEFRDIKNSKSKKENDLLLKIRNHHEEIMEKFEKENQKCKKLSEELEKKIKIIYLLKNYGNFIYKILGKKFWLDNIPEINHKTKNFELISDLVIEKYNSLNSRDKLNNEEYYFDDGILLIKYRDLEQKVLQSINSSGIRIYELKEKLYKEDMINKMNSRIPKLINKNDEITKNKNKLEKNVKEAKSIKFDNETLETFQDFIISLGRETEKYNFDGTIYFPDLKEKESINTIKENDIKYYTYKVLNSLKKKEALINRFIEYFDSIRKSEDKEIFYEIEQERKKISKKEKLRVLKQHQALLHYEKNKRAIERNTKFVIIGKKVPQIYKLTKTKISALIKENKAKDDMELLYYDENN